jgi:hypothetical protein
VNAALLHLFFFGGAQTTPNYWASIREGDILMLVVPSAGTTHTSPLVRVLSRSFTDGQPHQTLEVQYIRPLDLTTVHAAAESGGGFPAPVVQTFSNPVQIINLTKDEVANLMAQANEEDTKGV